MGKLQTFIGKLRFDYGYGEITGIFMCCNYALVMVDYG